MSDFAMATLGIVFTIIGLGGLAFLIAMAFYPEPIVDRHEFGDDL
jgi:hypothetical protein